jgi:hypothetical protein
LHNLGKGCRTSQTVHIYCCQDNDSEEFQLAVTYLDDALTLGALYKMMASNQLSKSKHKLTTPTATIRQIPAIQATLNQLLCILRTADCLLFTMASFLNLLGGASGLATLFSFVIPNNTPAERGNSLVTVQVGLDGTMDDDGPLTGAGGNFPLVVLFNNIGDPIGQTSDVDIITKTIGSGGFASAEIGDGGSYVHTAIYNKKQRAKH